MKLIKDDFLNNTVKKVNSNLNNAVKDSDGDGVINALDCQPYNPKKQGFIHDVINKIKEGHQQRVAVKKDISDKIAKREIAKEEDVDKYYAEGSKTKQLALNRIRELQRKKVYQEAYHQESLKKIKEKAIKEVQNKYSGRKNDFATGTWDAPGLFGGKVKKKTLKPRNKLIQTTRLVQVKGGLLKKVTGFKRVKIKTTKPKSNNPTISNDFWKL